MTMEKEQYIILDDADSKQIELADTAVKQSLAYEVRGKKQISFAGVKWLILKMSQNGQGISINIHDISLDDSDPDNKVWIATVKAKNMKTGLETIGASEQPWGIGGVRDPFGRTKALSKAERNAYRKQIPELEIQAMLEKADAETLQAGVISVTTSKPQPAGRAKAKTVQHTGSAPTEKQINYWYSLGGEGEPPATRAEISAEIDRMRSEK